MNLLRKLIVTGLGTGYLPVAPGTWGSAAVAGIFLAVAAISGHRVCVTGTMAVVAVLGAVGCVAWGGSFATKTFGKADPHACTIDEWVGQALVLILLPVGSGWKQWGLAAGVGFAAFRIFDILKPPPIRRLERLPGGWGVLLDDVGAAVYAGVAAQLTLHLWLLK